MHYRQREGYYLWAKQLRDCEDGENPAFTYDASEKCGAFGYKELGRIREQYALDENVCALIRRSYGVRYLLCESFHDDCLMRAVIRKDDCRVVFSHVFRGEYDFPYTCLTFCDVESCAADANGAFRTESLACIDLDIYFTVTGEINVTFQFAQTDGRFKPRYIRIVCRDVEVSGLSDYDSVNEAG